MLKSPKLSSLQRQDMILEVLRGAICPMTLVQIQNQIFQTQKFALKFADCIGLLIVLEQDGFVRQLRHGKAASSRWESIRKFGLLRG